MATFAEQINKWVAKTNRTMNSVVEDSVLTLGTMIVSRTPVGDPSLWESPPPPDYVPGTLINNWFSDLGAVTIGIVGKENLRGQNTSGSASIANLGAVAPNAAGTIFYFTNPTPWAFANEFGHSTQAPQGMVRISVRDFSTAVKKAIARNKK